MISKPPGEKSAKAVFEKLANCGKPAIACMFGIGSMTNESVTLTDTLLQAAEAAADKALTQQNNSEIAAKLASKLKPAQKHLKGLFTGGTL